MIDFFCEEVSVKDFEKKTTEAWINKCVEEESKTIGGLTIVFCTDQYLLEINQQYLKHDFYTDIITFDYSQDSIISGDLFISLDRVLDNSKQFQVSYANELRRVMIHGVLHLIGYGDKTNEEMVMMRFMEDKYLKLF